jgi:UDP-2-acetamido-2-deoxy-ribo-hexuluronate aminotransferase
VKFIDLQEQFRRYRNEIMDEIQKVLESAQFILGPAVGEFEQALARHTGAKHAIGCTSGTDALLLGLMAKGVGEGDEVIVPDFTFFATAEVIANIGAVPVFVDVEQDTYNIDLRLIERKISKRTKGIIPVSLYGQCPDLDEINALARSHGLWVMEDAAQSYGALYKGRRSGALTEVAATSFYPAKPLGGYGDGGAVFTSDDELARTIREMLNHGQSGTYNHVRLGINGRLDSLQAAVLKVKLRHFEEEMQQKRRIAGLYAQRLKGQVTVPVIREYNESVWAQFTVASPRREAVMAHLKTKGIPTAIHYPRPLHRQPAFSGMLLPDRDFPVSVKVSQEVFSLPMHPFLADTDVESVCDAISEALR